MQALKTTVAATIIRCGKPRFLVCSRLFITHNRYRGNDTCMGATIVDMIAAWWILQRLTLPLEEKA